MFGLRNRGPARPFAHAEGCAIVRADPDVEIPWQEIESGHWQAECRCGKEYFQEAPADRRTRLDPLDPSTSRHLGQCEYRDTTDPALLRVVLKVKEGLGGDYFWVECGACESSWQVPHYAVESVW